MRAPVLLLVAALAAAGALHTEAQQGAQGFDQRLQRGLQLLESGSAAEAIPHLEAAVAQRADSVEARYHLARALLTAGRPSDAVPHLEAALAAAPDPGPIHFLLAQAQLQLEELEAAGAALTAAAAARPDYPPIDYYRAELCYLLGRVDSARERFVAVAEAAPGWDMPRVRSGMIAMEQDEPEAAISWFRAALALNQNNPTSWMRLAAALVAGGQTDEAIAAYRQAVEVGPRFLPARIALIGQLNSVRDYDGMREALDGLFALEPDHPLGHYQLASLLSAQGENEQALQAVDIAVGGFEAQAAGVSDDERHTYRALSRGLRAQLLMKLGRNEEAEAAARAVIESDPWYPDAWFVLGTLLVRRGDAEGRALLERFKQLSDAREHREQADAALRAGDLDRAASEYELALAADPDDAASLVGMATILRRRDDADAALELLQRARPSGAQVMAWYRERILALAAAGLTEEMQAAWRTSRARGLDLGPEVWRVTRADIEDC